MGDESIEFIANFDNFISIKKKLINNKVKPTEVIEFLASIQVSVTKKIFDYVEKLIDVDDFYKNTKYLYGLDQKEFFEELKTKKLETLLTSYLPKYLDNVEQLMKPT